jgi:chromosome segregation ATPase
LWYSDNAVKAITDEIALVTKEINSATEKLDNDAFAKAKTSNTIVAYTEYIKNFPNGLSVEKATKTIDDIKKAQTLKELEEKKKTATPEEKKQIDAEINNILGVVTTQLKGTGGKILLYGGAGLVVIFILYKILGTKKATN